MTASCKFWLSVSAALLITFPAGSVPAQEGPAPGTNPTERGALSGLIDLLRSTGLPSLSGLIQPEKMGVLTDNPLTIRDNSFEPELLSGNEMKVLSDIRILSGITVNVHLHIAPGEPDPPERQADKPPRKRKHARTSSPKPARAQRGAADGSTR